MMRILKVISRCLLILIGLPISLILLHAGWFYAICPIYKFDEPVPFSGESFYNPYQNIYEDAWQKSIFHLHTKSWGGMTDGGNSFDEILPVYRNLKYDVINFSDYMSINSDILDNPTYIPVYEHGYGVNMVHQLAIGARKVVWRDYIFGQNLNQKQHIIDMLKKHSQLVALNHPARRKAYTHDDLKYLSNYDFIEILNARRLNETEWDIALSNGHKVWLIANDDSHHIQNPDILHLNATFINVQNPTSSNILERFAQGAAFGVRFLQNRPSTMAEKEQEAEAVSYPKDIYLINNILHVHWQTDMDKIEFIGDNGIVLKTVSNSDLAYYTIQPQDTYVRTRLTSTEGFVYFLNPIIRQSNDYSNIQLLSSINKPKTFLKRILIVLGLLTTVVFIFLLKRKYLKIK